MNVYILQISILSIVCGFMTSLVPDGGTKHVARILGTAIMLLAVVEPLSKLKLESTDFYNTKLYELESEFADRSEWLISSLNKTGIEEQCREYILDKARQNGVMEIDVSVELKENDDGFFIPWAAKFCGNYSNEQKMRLSELILSDLGIPKERQMWING